eukprot:3658178-Heterocapsa_arctica.AAC.1
MRSLDAILATESASSFQGWPACALMRIRSMIKCWRATSRRSAHSACMAPYFVRHTAVAAPMARSESACMIALAAGLVAMSHAIAHAMAASSQTLASMSVSVGNVRRTRSARTPWKW